MNRTDSTQNGVSRIVKISRPIILALFLAGILAGCAKKTGGPTGPVFFPPPPDDPHIQFLTGVTTSDDLGVEKSDMSRLITGGSKVITSLTKPMGMTIHKGILYVCDIKSSQVVKIDFVNKTMKSLIKDSGPGKLLKPISIAIDDDGYLYVADNGRKDVAVYDSTGKFIKAFGKEFEHQNVTGVAAYKQFLLVLDNRYGKLTILDRKSGEIVTKIGEDPDTTKNLSMPNGMTIDPKGVVYVVNVGNGKVKKYDTDGHLLEEFGRIGDRPGEFTRPRGIAVDDDGWMFIADAGNGVVQVFNEKNRILGFFGEPGLGTGSLNLPTGVVVSKENLDLFQKMAAPGFKLQEVIFVTNQLITPITHGLAVYGVGEMEGAKKTAPADKKTDVKEDNPEKK